MERSDFVDQRFAKDPSVVTRTIAGELILVPISQRAEDVDKIYTMNRLGRRIWELIDGQKPAADIRDAIVGEFEVSREEAEADLVDLLLQLEQVGAVRVI